MRQSGRVNIVLIIAVVVVFSIASILFVAFQPSPATSASKFMDALESGDVNTLCKYSYWQGSQEDLRKKWDFAVNQAGKYYVFLYQLKDEKVQTPTRATVQIKITKDASSPTAYPEDTEIPMEKQDGQWKVAVHELDRSIYPALP